MVDHNLEIREVLMPYSAKQTRAANLIDCETELQLLRHELHPVFGHGQSGEQMTHSIVANAREVRNNLG